MPIMDVFIGIIFGIIFAKYVFPVFDVLIECFTYKMTVSATRNEVAAKKIVTDFEKEYEEKPSAIGFQYAQEESLIDYDEEIDDKLKNNIGFRR